MSETMKEWGTKVSSIATDFEMCNSDLKRQYFIRNIEGFNKIASMTNVCCGTFGTGYPFYVLDEELQGQLPVIQEQIRYNAELIRHATRTEFQEWTCSGCLPENYDDMPDLKQVCKPCPNMDSELKPRKFINRLPDIDMWIVCRDGHVEDAQEQLTELFKRFNIHTSDVDPLQSIQDVGEITDSLKKGIMPSKFLPIDAHIIEYSKIKGLMEQVPSILQRASQDPTHRSPYLPIHPKSYRKKWQYDDEAYNYIYDFLSAFTAFNFDDELMGTLEKARKTVVENYSSIELFTFMIQSATEANKRRFRNHDLMRCFSNRMKSWGRIQIPDGQESSRNSGEEQNR